jgi:hypothetical protein
MDAALFAVKVIHGVERNDSIILSIKKSLTAITAATVRSLSLLSLR